MASRPSIVTGVDARELTQLYRDLKAAGDDVGKNFLRQVRSAADPVAQAATDTASSFSTKIPPTIRTVVSGGRAKVKVSIRAGGPKAPNAAPLENRGKPGKFRHPVGGNKDVWVEQDAHPFLLPALQENLDRVADRLSTGIDETLKGHNL